MASKIREDREWNSVLLPAPNDVEIVYCMLNLVWVDIFLDVSVLETQTWLTVWWHWRLTHPSGFQHRVCPLHWQVIMVNFHLWGLGVLVAKFLLVRTENNIETSFSVFLNCISVRNAHIISNKMKYIIKFGKSHPRVNIKPKDTSNVLLSNIS